MLLMLLAALQRSMPWRSSHYLLWFFDTSCGGSPYASQSCFQIYRIHQRHLKMRTQVVWLHACLESWLFQRRDRYDCYGCCVQESFFGRDLLHEGPSWFTHESNKVLWKGVAGES